MPPSPEAETRRPSALQAIWVSTAVLPSRIISGARPPPAPPVVTSQIRTRPSAAMPARREPSGLKAIGPDAPAPGADVSSRTSWPEPASRSRYDAPAAADLRQETAVGAVRQAGGARSRRELEPPLARTDVPDADLSLGPGRIGTGGLREGCQAGTVGAERQAQATTRLAGPARGSPAAPCRRRDPRSSGRSRVASPGRSVTTANRRPGLSKDAECGQRAKSPSVHTSRPVSQSKTLSRQACWPDPSRTRAANTNRLLSGLNTRGN